MSQIYTHYGKQDHLDITLIRPVKNRPFIKPDGGFWGSIGDSWERWCKSNDFETDGGIGKSFKFKVNGKVLSIRTAEDLPKLEKYRWNPYEGLGLSIVDKSYFLDYEKLEQDYDAIEIYAGSDTELYQAFYGWDVDSVLVMNPYSLEEVEDKPVTPHKKGEWYKDSDGVWKNY